MIDRNIGRKAYTIVSPTNNAPIRGVERGGFELIAQLKGLRALARMIHDSSAAIADPLFRQACGRRTRPSDLRRTARVRFRSSRFRAPVSRRGLAISRRTVMNHAG